VKQPSFSYIGVWLFFFMSMARDRKVLAQEQRGAYFIFVVLFLD